MSEGCTGERRFETKRERGSGWLKMGEAAVHRGQRPWTCSGELVEGEGGRGRKGPPVLRAGDAEAAPGDTIPEPKVDGRPWNGRATVPESTVACSRARALHAMALFMC